MRTFVSMLCGVALAWTTVLAADVSGTWSVDGDVYGNPVKFTCTLTQEAEALTGTAALESGDVPVTGIVAENTVTFEYDAEHQGTTYHLVFTGIIGEDGVMTGTIAVAGVEGQFTAKKQ
jgi:hypothetical protein